MPCGVDTSALGNYLIVADTASRPTGSARYEGLQIWQSDIDTILTWDGTAWRGEWVTSFVPTVSQGVSTNIAKTVNKSEYRYDGTMIDFTFALTLTAAGTAGSSLQITIPVTSLWVSPVNIGYGSLYDLSGTGRNIAQLEATSGTTLMFGVDQAVGAGGWGQHPNLAAASGDILRGSVRYRWR